MLKDNSGLVNNVPYDKENDEKRVVEMKLVGEGCGTYMAAKGEYL